MKACRHFMVVLMGCLVLNLSGVAWAQQTDAAAPPAEESGADAVEQPTEQAVEKTTDTAEAKEAEATKEGCAEAQDCKEDMTMDLGVPGEPPLPGAVAVQAEQPEPEVTTLRTHGGRLIGSGVFFAIAGGVLTGVGADQNADEALYAGISGLGIAAILAAVGIPLFVMNPEEDVQKEEMVTLQSKPKNGNVQVLEMDDFEAQLRYVASQQTAPKPVLSIAPAISPESAGLFMQLGF